MDRQMTLRELTARRHPATKHFAPLFDYDHLPSHLRPISKACHDLAWRMVADIPDGPELTVGLRKLLEAKDAFVRALLLGAPAPEPRADG